MATTALTLCVLLWAHEGRETDLVEHEDRVLHLVSSHGATLLSRVRSDGEQGHPLEVQLFEFPSQKELDEYMGDPKRTAMADDRDRAVARTEIMRVERV